MFGNNASKYATFPLVAVGWNIANDNFMKPVKLVTALKLRASYGTTGNEAISPYGTITSLAVTPYVNGGLTSVGLSAATIGNANLKWKSTTSANIGLEFGLFNNRFTGTIEYYDSRTSDLILSRRIPVISGYGSGAKPGDLKFADLNGDGKITTLDRTYLNKFILADLTFAVANLVDIDKVVKSGRMSNAAAKRLLAEFYLRTNQPVLAEQQCQDIIATGRFKLVTSRYGTKSTLPGDPSSDMFVYGNQRRNQGNTESIWVIENEFNVIGGRTRLHNIAGFGCPFMQG